MPAAIVFEAGQKFGRLTIVSRAEARPGERNVMWLCDCECGAQTVVAAANIGKSTLSCGCLVKNNGAHLRGNTMNRTHNMSQSLEYKSWCSMKGRCNNPNNPKYYSHGGRGIKICERWLSSFENFYADMGPKPGRGYSIERVNNGGNYEPGNCIWATPKVQAKNRRSTVFIEINGTTLNIEEWCEFLHIPRWRVGELTKGRGRKGDLPPTCKSSEEAVRLLYKQTHG